MAGWNDLDWQLRDDLTTWYNRSVLDREDKTALLRLVRAGRFHAYDCGHCDKRVYQGNPDNWERYQGVLQDEGVGQLCSECYGMYLLLHDLAKN